MTHTDPTEIRAAAYRIAMNITPKPWDPTEVGHRADRILKFITGDEFELRVAALDLQMIALGVGPGRSGHPDSSQTVADLPDAERLIEQARKVLAYLKAGAR